MIVTTLEIVFAVAYFSKHHGVASICHTEMGSIAALPTRKTIAAFPNQALLAPWASIVAHLIAACRVHKAVLVRVH